ncbi:ZmpA/ZmpB/ZmpC family metallo-endopeptidase [Rothia nasimurium]|uniref:ZmpA/ZmpB/ZmpC family metallo-endopeptidase n=1 Tax=Rothia nasimurium TaxID=85336 RepID=UPI001F1E6FD7|nr:ZmpA/ZmpB/ZmpC family metallo-endopeptidase [Rothia nasimurium]
MPTSPIHRRTLIQGAAWSAPTIIASSAVPAYAASTPSADLFATLAAELGGISFTESQTVYDSLSPTIRITDITNKRLEISRRTRRPFSSVTEAEARAELQPEVLKATGLEKQFNVSKLLAQNTLTAIAANPLYAHLSEAERETLITNKVSGRKEQFLLGLAYLRSLYSFELGGVNVAEALITDPAQFGITGVDPVDYILNIGSQRANVLAFSNSPTAHRTVVRLPELTSFIADRAGTSDLDAWMREQSGAIIADDAAPLYSKLAADPATQRFILPLLSQETDGVYVATTPASITFGHTYTYVDPATAGSSTAEKTAFIDELNRRAAEQNAFVELWTRLTPSYAGELTGNRLAIDTFQGYKAQNISASWLPKTSPGAISDFFAPLNLWAPYTQATAQAEGTGMRYFMGKAISANGVTTYGHEMTHLIDDTLLTNGGGLRDGFGPETIARGIFEGPDSPTSAIVGFNQYFDWTAVPDRLHNGTPEQFATKQDLSAYMRSQLDTLYLLDALEAEAILRRPAEERAVLLNRLSQTPRGTTGHTDDTFSTITVDEAAALSTVEDFTTQGLVVSRYQWRGISTIGTAPANSYYTIPLFDPAYGAYTPTTGAAGDITVRRQAFDLLAYKGYDEGLVPYISNQYKTAAGGALSDSFIMGQIGIADYTADRASRYRQGLERAEASAVFPFTHRGQTIASLDDLRAQFDQALAADLPHLQQARAGSTSAIWSVTAVRELKASFYRAAMQL